MLFIDYSSAFNPIVPSKLITKLRTIGLKTSLCNLILNFLTGRPQVGRVGNNISATLILNTGAPVPSPLLYSLFTHDCMARDDSNTIIKFSDDTTVAGLTTDNNETAYREKVRDVVMRCQDNNLSLNVIKTKEMIVDYRKRRTEHGPILINSGTGVELQVPWCPHQQQTRMVQTHQDSREESTTKPFPPQETENIWHGSSDPQKVLQLHHRDHPDWLHHCLVWQLQGSTEANAYGPVLHWGQASCHPGPLYHIYYIYIFFFLKQHCK